MNLKEHILADVEIFFNQGEFAETINYDGSDILAIVEVGANWENGNIFSSGGRASRVKIWVKAIDVDTTEPETMVIVNGESYQVAQVLESMNGLHYLEIIGSESPF